jgi:pyruvate dehydrogenase (quinone)
MGCAVPYAIGAKFARDGRAHHHREVLKAVAGPRLVVMVLQDDDLNQVTWELRAMGGSPQFLPSQQLPSVDDAAFARRFGLDGIYVEDPDDVGPAWTEALATRRPCVIVFRTDPAVPPIPPHASWDQIVNAAESVLRGDSERVDIIREGVKSKLAGILPDAPR